MPVEWDEDLATCYHEAGHVVVDIALALPFSSVRVYDPGITDADNLSGIVQVPWFLGLFSSQPPEIWSHQRLRDAITDLYAAGIAADRYTGDYDEESIVLDFDQIAKLVTYTSVKDKDALLARCYRRAKRLVDKHWAEIEAVAQALQNDRHLNDRDVITIIEGVSGKRATRAFRAMQEREHAAWLLSHRTK
jgi:hypothetical protein